ncbi:Protein CBG26082 [Caenorhabditis briggsae]|uniref:Protein CBG26082 n=1 Tax=Caenorhabditis briggsae TaxID=6238 RepID=B6IJJ2_CAEBR|nr:Protein CBG26082 [Caenorhabditis briggsae]CAS00072.1 Protein CBG26082 [Caenorhabditis briggsae]
MEDEVISKSPIFERKFKEYFGDFDKTKQRIEDLLDSIHDWLSQVAASQDNSFLDFSSTFSKCPKLEELDLMTDRRLMAIEKIGTIVATPNLQTDAAAFKKSLLDLSKLDLQFSRFQKSLEMMPLTIQRLAKNLAKNVQDPTTLSPPMKAVTAQQMLRLSTGSSNNSTSTVIAVVGGFEMYVSYLGKTLATTESTAATVSTSVTQNSTEAARPSGSTTPIVPTPAVPVAPPPSAAPAPATRPNITPSVRAAGSFQAESILKKHKLSSFGFHCSSTRNTSELSSSSRRFSEQHDASYKFAHGLLGWGFQPPAAETDTNPNPDATVSERDRDIPITDPKFGNKKSRTA